MKFSSFQKACSNSFSAEVSKSVKLALCASVAIFTASMNTSAFANTKVKSFAYKAQPGVSGTLKSIGSDSMNNEMALWAEGFQKYYPGVKVEVEGKGSATAPAALTAGTAQLGPMSRPMKQEEVEAFAKKYGYKPTEIKTSLDVLAVYVHKDNPLTEISLEQVDAAYSKTRKGGFAKDIVTWGDLGATGEWATKPISLYGRNSASGTYGYFKEHALFKGDFKSSVKEQPGSSSVVQGVAGDKFGMGYSGVGYITSGVKALKLSQKKGEFIEPNYETAISGKYPLSRFLLVYINKADKAALQPLTKEFLTYVLSQEGQIVVEKTGYLPLTEAMISKEMDKLK
jgi:phosphate transport system substrate-binding protein